MLRSLRTSVVRLIFGLLVLQALSFFSELFLSCPHHQCSLSTQALRNHTIQYDEAESHLFNFDDPPVSFYRPQIRYNPNPLSLRNLGLLIWAPNPVLTVITVTRNPRPIFIDTAHSVLNQTLRSIRWLIINDHTDDPVALRLIQTIPSTDRRIVSQNSSRAPGFCEGRLHALSYLHERPTDFFAFLDDDDLLEPTFYEKCILALHSVPNASACGSFVVGFGDRNYTWRYGFHNNARIVVANPLTGSEVVRTSALNATSCTFDSGLNTGMEDWDFFLCLASRGHWGITIPEYLIWYRQNPVELRQKRWNALFERDNATASLLRERYKELRLNFPVVDLSVNHTAGSPDLRVPFHNPLPVSAGLVVIVPWIRPDREGELFSYIINALAKRGSHVTVITLLHGYQGYRSLRLVTPDIISAPIVSHASDIARLLSYVIESRRPRGVVVLHGITCYPSLPVLALRFPFTAFMDIVLSTADDELRVASREHARWLDASIMLSPSPFSFYSTREQHRAGARDLLQLRKKDVVLAIVAHGGWLAHAETLVYAASDAASRLTENNSISTPSNNSQTIQGRNVKVFVTTADKGSSLALRKIARENHRYIFIIPFAGAAMVDRLIAASNVVCAALAQGVLAVVDANQLPMNVLHDGILRVPPGVNISDADTLAQNSSSSTDVVALSSLMVRKLEATTFAESVADVTNKTTNMTWAKGEELDVVNDVVHAVQNTRPSILRRLALTSRINMIAHWDIHKLISDVRRLTDIANVQQDLYGRTRGTFGEDYRYNCGEYNEAHTTLLDILESGVLCDGATSVNLDKLQKYSLEQCGRWCVMDFSDQKRQSGWWIRESCGIEPFNNESHKCTEWFKNISSLR